MPSRSAANQNRPFRPTRWTAPACELSPWIEVLWSSRTRASSGAFPATRSGPPGPRRKNVPVEGQTAERAVVECVRRSTQQSGEASQVSVALQGLVAGIRNCFSDTAALA